MVKILSLDDLTAIVGDAAGAVSVMTDCVGTTVDSWSTETNSECAIDREMRGTLEVIRDLFAAGLTGVLEQSGITVQATDLGKNVLRNSDIDGSNVVQSAEA
ncbi:hypothetical protein [Nocardia carnea]|uniref:Uncharacterized protein n=1 Tax=Nocardia carnea TaxID=37328 RepID=A0ABW7TLL0_9NOCA|nr:hypothetical protein [Nocardia carnea]